MSEKEYRLFLVSDFTMSNFGGYLLNDDDFPRVRPDVVPIHEMIPSLLEGGDRDFDSTNDFAIFWTQPESVIKSFRDVLDYRSVQTKQVLSEVDEYCELILKMKGKVSCVFVSTWVIPYYYRGTGLMDMKGNIGITNTLMQMNLRLSEYFDQVPNFFVLNAGRWFEAAGPNAFNQKLWYMSKTPFDNKVFKEAVRDIKSAFRGINGMSRKLLILDLDDTLWGGIVGDIGWENINLGGHDPVGEAFLDFQKAIKSLQNRGIVLAIVSKNEEFVALEAINQHSEMVLNLKDFAGWRINWNDKAQNIVELVSELNLGLDSAVFIDDNPVERDRIRTALPEVFVPDWPADKAGYKAALLELRCFDAPLISDEDIERAKMYASERQRKEIKAKYESVESWLKTLELRVVFEDINKANLPRISQLLNKTNQMNLSTRRMSESELFKWAQSQERKLWSVRVADRFGDSGLTGIMSLDYSNGTGKIVDFILSCRVFGRKIENIMLYKVIEFAQSIGLSEVYAEYIETKKNKPCYTFFKASGLSYADENHTFRWVTSMGEYDMPEHIHMKGKSSQ